MSACNNLVNKLCHRIKNLESTVDNLLLLINKPETMQVIESSSVELQQVEQSLTYMNPTEQTLFNVEVNSNNHSVMDIKVSVSFIVTAPNDSAEDIENGSVTMKLRINNTAVTENETIVSTGGYLHLTLNFVQDIEPDSIYDVEIIYEGLVRTSNVLPQLPVLSTKNDGGSLSILLI